MVTPRLPRIAKWLLAFVAGVLLLVVLALLVLQHWVGTEDFRQRVDREATAALGFEVVQAARRASALRHCSAKVSA